MPAVSVQNGQESVQKKKGVDARTERETSSPTQEIKILTNLSRKLRAYFSDWALGGITNHSTTQKPVKHRFVFKEKDLYIYQKRKSYNK